MNQQITKPQIDLKPLVLQYVIAKGELSAARMEMERAEEALLAAVGAKEEGSQTVTVGDYKVTTTGKINRSLDAKAWDALKQQIPEPLANRLVRYKAEINLTELKFIAAHEPSYYAMVAPAITSKPAKTSVEVKEIV